MTFDFEHGLLVPGKTKFSFSTGTGYESGLLEFNIEEGSPTLRGDPLDIQVLHLAKAYAVEKAQDCLPVVSTRQLVYKNFPHFIELSFYDRVAAALRYAVPAAAGFYTVASIIKIIAGAAVPAVFGGIAFLIGVGVLAAFLVWDLFCSGQLTYQTYCMRLSHIGDLLISADPLALISYALSKGSSLYYGDDYAVLILSDSIPVKNANLIRSRLIPSGVFVGPQVDTLALLSSDGQIATVRETFRVFESRKWTELVQPDVSLPMLLGRKLCFVDGFCDKVTHNAYPFPNFIIK